MHPAPVQQIKWANDMAELFAFAYLIKLLIFAKDVAKAESNTTSTDINSIKSGEIIFLGHDYKHLK